jgi:PAS domain S-box-containing protein
MARLLVIDDNDLNRSMLARRLTRRGHEVSGAATAAEGLAMLASSSPDLVLLDLGPGTDELRADAAARDVPVVGMFAKGEADRAATSGCDACLPKPVNLPALHATLERLLRDRGLPLPEPHVEASAPRAPGEPPLLLVIDDEAFNRDMLSRRLERRGYRVRTSPDGPDALARIAEERFDLVLLDWMMPEMSGVEVLQRIREVHPATYLPVVMATAKVTSEDVVLALEAGANDYVTKPLDFPVVIARIQAQLDLRAANEALRSSDARFRHLAESSPDLIARLSPDGTFLYCSPASRALLGHEPAELVGKSAHDLVHADDFADLAERFVVEADSPGQFTVTCRLARRDGMHAWFEIAYLVLRDPATGDVAELQATYRNVDGQVKQRDDAFERVLSHLARAAETRREDADGHVLRVGRTAELLTLRMGQGALRADLVRRAAMLHDFGNVAVPPAWLRRRGPLSDDERKVVRTHTTIGHDLLSGSGDELLDLAALIAFNHHERHDGTGYPRGRRGRAVPLEARIVGIADVFDALTSARPWRPAFPPEEAARMIRDGSGSQFDPELVEHFLAILDEVVALRRVWPDPA